MSAGRYPIYIEQGTTIDFEVQYKDSTGAPVDLTGYGARMQIRPTVTSETVYLSLTSNRNTDGTGISMSGSAPYKPPTSGSLGIYIASCTSSMLDFGDAVYDLEIFAPIDSDCPEVTRILQGPVRLSKEVTR
jgi:hypothetical protein